MPLGHMIEYVLVTVNTEGQEVELSSFVTDPDELMDICGNPNESIVRISGEHRSTYRKWNSEKNEWQMIN